MREPKTWYVWNPSPGTYFRHAAEGFDNIYLIDEGAEHGLTRYSSSKAGEMVVSERLGVTDCVVRLPKLSDIPWVEVSIEAIKAVRAAMIVTYQAAHRMGAKDRLPSPDAGRRFGYVRAPGDTTRPLKIEIQKEYASVEVLEQVGNSSRILFTTEALAAIIGVSVSALHRLAADGKLNCTKKGSMRYLTPEQMVVALSNTHVYKVYHNSVRRRGGIYE